jgi:hypothetical protein
MDEQERRPAVAYGLILHKIEVNKGEERSSLVG